MFEVTKMKYVVKEANNTKCYRAIEIKRNDYIFHIAAVFNMI